MQGTLRPVGNIRFQVTRRVDTQSLWAIAKAGLPIGSMSRTVRTWRIKNLFYFLRGFIPLCLARITTHLTGIPIMYGILQLAKINPDGTRVDLGVASLRKVTTAFVNYVATRLFDANTSIGAFDFHGFGSNNTAESNGDTALNTEYTTQYATDNVRPTGTPTNPSANVYQSVATFSPDSGGTLAVVEHGIFTQAATGGGTLMDRSVFASVSLVAGSDSLQATYQLTLTAEA